MSFIERVVQTGTSSDTMTASELANIAFLAWSSFSIFLMIQGAGLFYSGLSKRKSALTQAALSLVVTAVVQIQWFVWGYSLSFARNASKFIGTLQFAGFYNLTRDYNSVPELGSAVFQSMLACLTAALLVGSIADRARIVPLVVFIFIWSTVVYDPIACWTWNRNGWGSTMGYLDYAGGTPIHMCAGMTALAYSFMVGKKYEEPDLHRPHSTMFVVIGTCLLWVGWFGFNSGANLVATPRAVQALLNTQIAAAVGGFAWVGLDFRMGGKWSIVGFCSGVISGLVSITPAAGFVPSWSAPVFGLLGGLLCNTGTKIKYYLKIDDSLDVFAVHGVGAMVGNILTALFASVAIAGPNGPEDAPFRGGWLDHHYIQLGYQLAVSLAAAGYSFVVSVLILYIIRYIPGLHLRITPEDEELGIDLAEHDEYAFDYVELYPDLPLDEEILGADKRGPAAQDSFVHDGEIPLHDLNKGGESANDNNALNPMYLHHSALQPGYHSAGEQYSSDKEMNYHQYLSSHETSKNNTTTPSTSTQHQFYGRPGSARSVRSPGPHDAVNYSHPPHQPRHHENTNNDDDTNANNNNNNNNYSHAVATSACEEEAGPAYRRNHRLTQPTHPQTFLDGLTRTRSLDSNVSPTAAI